MNPDARWMAAAAALGERGRGLSAPNPNVGCVIVKDDVVVGRGWTQPGGRPHAEAVALEAAGEAARGATAFVTLEPCAHVSTRGPACARLLREAGVERIVVAMQDPDARTNGSGLALLREGGARVEVLPCKAAERSLAGFLTRQRLGRPCITLKLAMSLDGKIALPSGESRWITGEEARAHAHLERARCDMILVGRGTYEADAPRLNVRLEGLETRSPPRAILTHGPAPEGWSALESVDAVHALTDVNDLLVEGGSATASAFLAADLVDRLLIYRALILIGEGLPALTDIGLGSLAEAHGRWTLADSRTLGRDRLEVYERAR